MLWFDGKGVACFKKSSTGVAEDTLRADGKVNKMGRFKLLFEFGLERGVIIIVIIIIITIVIISIVTIIIIIFIVTIFIFINNMPNLFAQSLCGNSVSPSMAIFAIILCHHLVPSFCAIILCHHFVPSFCAIILCHHLVPSFSAIIYCHHFVPSFCAIILGPFSYKTNFA